MPKVGELIVGKVVKIVLNREKEKEIGALVKLSANETGFLHISEISDDYIRKISDHLTVGQEVEVRVIGIKRKENKINLSMIRADEGIHRQVLFEAKMSRFLKDSGERLKQIQKNQDRKQSGKRKNF